MSICKPRGVVPSREEWARMHQLRERHECFAIVLGKVKKTRYVQIVPEREDRHNYARMLSLQLRLGNAVLYCGYYRPETVTFEEEDFSTNKRLRVWTSFYAEFPEVMKALSRERELAERCDPSLVDYVSYTRRDGSEGVKTVHHTTLNSYWEAAGIMLEKGKAFSDAAIQAGVCPDKRTVEDMQERMRILSLASWGEDYKAIVPEHMRPRTAQVSTFTGRSVPRRERSIGGPMLPRDRYEAATYYREPQAENPYRRRCPNHGFQRTDHSNRLMSWMGAIY